MLNEVNGSLKLNICMLLPHRYEPGMRVDPQLGIVGYLAKFGHRITWILSSEKTRSTQQTFLNDIDTYVVPFSHRFGNIPLFGKALDKVLYALRRMRLILIIARKGKYDMIFSREDAFDGLIAVYLKKRYKTPLVFELISPLEEGWETARAESKSGILAYLTHKLMALARIYIMKRADLVLPTTRWFEEGLVKKGISTSKMFPYYNGVDMVSFTDRDGEKVRVKYHLGGSKIFIYIGVIGIVRKPEVLIRAFSRVKKERQNVKLLMVGDGSGRKNLEKLTGDLGLEKDVIFTGQVLQTEVPDFIAAADIGVSPIPPLSFYKVSSPIKMLEYMAMAMPVVASEEILDHKEVLEQSGGGILVPFKEEEFARAMVELLDDPRKASEMGRRGREWILKNRTYEILAHRLEERLIQMTTPNVR